MFKFLYEDSKLSTMRVNSFIAILGTLFLVSVIGFYILYRTFECPDAIAWSQISVFLGTLSAFNAPFIYGKVSQKKIEKHVHERKPEVLPPHEPYSKTPKSLDK